MPILFKSARLYSNQFSFKFSARPVLGMEEFHLKHQISNCNEYSTSFNEDWVHVHIVAKFIEWAILPCFLLPETELNVHHFKIQKRDLTKFSTPNQLQQRLACDVKSYLAQDVISLKISANDIKNYRMINFKLSLISPDVLRHIRHRFLYVALSIQKLNDLIYIESAPYLGEHGNVWLFCRSHWVHCDTSRMKTSRWAF